jgi:hypothetical protein
MRTLVAVGVAAGVLLGLGGTSARAELDGVPTPESTPVSTAGDARVKGLDGTVRTVDRHVKTVRVADTGSYRRDTVLLLTDNTEIRVAGRRGSLEDVREGLRIRVAYEDRYGINVVRSIEVSSEGERTRPNAGQFTP